MSPIRIVTAAMLPLIRQIVETAIAAEPDLVLAGSVDRLDNFDVIARQLSADIVITTESDVFPINVKELLAGATRPIVFVVGANGRSMTRYALLLDEGTIENVSLSGLAEALRAAAKNRSECATSVGG